VSTEYNPRYYPDPETFKPSRWYNLGTTSDDIYTAFSNGPRACIGRKFALTEAVCFLANLLRDYEVSPFLKDNGRGKMETLEEWKGRVLDKTSFELSLFIQNAALILKRR
jgi:hypothetical protein